MTRVIRIGPQPSQPELIDMAEALLRRVRDGLVIGLALVEHREGDEVAIQTYGPASYHQLNSGAARLAHMLASATEED